jgi:F-box and WD-40 domain protein 1/11
VGGESKPLENVPEEVELELRHTLSGHAMNVAAAQISLDGRYMYTASGDRSLRIWDLESGTCVKKLDGVASMLQFQLIQGGRGTTVLGACTDSTVRLYKINMEDGTCTVKSCLEGHMNVVRSVKIFGDFRGRRGAGKDWKIVSVSYDGTVKIWGRTEEKEESLGWECVKTLSFSDEVLTPFTVLNHQEVTDEGFVNVKHVPSKVLDVQVDGTWVYCCGEGAEILAWEL